MLVSNVLIGLREGLEAAIVVLILVAFLVKTDRSSALRWVWLGVGAAVLLSVAVGAALHYGTSELSFTAQEAVGGFASIVAVAFVTWMVLWMRTAARSMSGTLRAGMETALRAGPVAVAVMAFLAVGREGLETALFFFSSVQAANGGTAQPLLGFALGLATAVLLGYLMYRGAVRINLSRFFTVTGVLLVVVAAGILAYGVHDLQEAGILPGLNTLAFDVSAHVRPDSWLGTLLKGIFNFSPATTVLEAVVWVLYVVIVLTLFLRPTRSAAPTPATAALRS
ncbi:iron uptake transporter permease EfeU [Rhodococcus sp. X156]|uniref:iron uptake transporter permease EfeU n=1 Tax=Rhodococcus sp. X156 TaxID=2499145 RepID=UPI000FD8B508|nr:iron uptake transporter permease EfeU [Rhodococcus sp. X156]